MSSTLRIASNLSIFTANHERKEDIFYPAVHELTRLAVIEKAAIALIKCNGQNHAEPFGYFNNPHSDGWQLCNEHDEGAIALYEHPPINHIADAKKMVSGNQVDDINVVESNMGIPSCGGVSCTEKDHSPLCSATPRPSAIELQHAEIGIPELVTELINPAHQGGDHANL